MRALSACPRQKGDQHYFQVHAAPRAYVLPSQILSHASTKGETEEKGGKEGGRRRSLSRNEIRQGTDDGAENRNSAQQQKENIGPLSMLKRYVGTRYWN